MPTVWPGIFPFDEAAGLTARRLTPALERVTALAGTVADGFEKGADLLEEMAGVRLGESTVERTAEDAGQRLKDLVQAGVLLGTAADWPWHKDYDGRRCAYVEIDATGVRQQGEAGGPAEGRMAYVGMVCNPCPDRPWPDQKPGPMQARYLSGSYALEHFAPLPRARPARWAWTGPIAGSGSPTAAAGWRSAFVENFPRVEVIILDFFHPAEKLTGLARLLPLGDEERAEEQARARCQLLKAQGGAVLAAVLRDGTGPAGRA